MGVWQEAEMGAGFDVVEAGGSVRLAEQKEGVGKKSVRQTKDVVRMKGSTRCRCDRLRD